MTTANNYISPKYINFKCIVLGESNVGKSSIVRQFVSGTFEDYYCGGGVGASFYSKHLLIDNRGVKLEIWDTAGQERYCSMSPMYYRNSKCCLLCFDVNNERSFKRLDYWREELIKGIKTTTTPTTTPTDINQDNSIPIIVLGNKIDLINTRVVSNERAQEWCKKNGNLRYIDTSAKNSTNIEQAFTIIAKGALENYDILPTISIKPSDDDTKKVQPYRCCWY